MERLATGFDKGRVVPLGRFWERVVFTASCWLWVGAKEVRGYGVFLSHEKGKDKRHKAHRLALSAALGRQLLAGLVVDHLCRVTSCVNPDHLEEVPQRVNIDRGEWGNTSRTRKAKTHCKRGHALEGDNLIVNRRKDGSMYRNCRLCVRAASRAHEQRVKDSHA